MRTKGKELERDLIRKISENLPKTNARELIKATQARITYRSLLIHGLTRSDCLGYFASAHHPIAYPRSFIFYWVDS